MPRDDVARDGLWHAAASPRIGPLFTTVFGSETHPLALLKFRANLMTNKHFERLSLTWLAKVDVEGSNPFARSTEHRCLESRGDGPAPGGVGAEWSEPRTAAVVSGSCVRWQNRSPLERPQRFERSMKLRDTIRASSGALVRAALVAGLTACGELPKRAPEPAMPALSTSNSVVASSNASSISTAAPNAKLHRFVSGEAPIYPEESRRHGEEGVVELRIALRYDGQIRSVDVIGSSGHPRLDRAAVDAVRNWRFQPSTGDTSDESLVHRIAFRLVDAR